jgi:predicted AAA+ superfamily ATPase
MNDISHYEKNFQVQIHQQELRQDVAQWRLAHNARPSAPRRRVIPALLIRVLAVLRLGN